MVGPDAVKNYHAIVVLCAMTFSACSTLPERNYTGIDDPIAYATIIAQPSVKCDFIHITSVNGKKTGSFWSSNTRIVDVNPGRNTLRVHARHRNYSGSYNGFVSFSAVDGRLYSITLGNYSLRHSNADAEVQPILRLQKTDYLENKYPQQRGVYYQQPEAFLVRDTLDNTIVSFTEVEFVEDEPFVAPTINIEYQPASFPQKPDLSFPLK